MNKKLLASLGVLCLAGLATTANAADLPNQINKPEKALVLKLDREQWQALAAVCMTPAFYNSGSAVPLIFDDGTAKREVAIPHATATVKDLGADAVLAPAAIAKQYWKKAECVFVVSDYEQALWVVPNAALLAAPIATSSATAGV